jgi:hypothetical protein
VSPSSTFSLPGRRRGSEPSLEACSRRSLTRFASLMISRHSEALWRLLGWIGHDPLLPPCCCGRLPRSFRPPVTAATTGAADYDLSWSWFFFLLLLPPWVAAPEPPVWVTLVCGAKCQVPCTALGSSGTFVGQSEERSDGFYVMRR